MTSGVRKKLIPVMLAFSIGLIGCDRGNGDGDSDAQATSMPGAPAPDVNGTFKLTGALVKADSYSVSYGFPGTEVRTCESVAATRDNYVIPVPTITKSKENRFNWTARVAGYTGPGTYDLDDIGVLQVDVRKEAKDDPTTFKADDGSTATLVVKRDNSGSLKFTGLSGPTDGKLGGTLTWTCTDPDEANE